MRIVPNLTELHECPNCGDTLTGIYNVQTGRHSKFCHNCHEMIFENETTCSEEIATKEKEKENFIFEMREEISHLTWSLSINDTHSVVLVQNIQNILNRIIDYIEEN